MSLPMHLRTLSIFVKVGERRSFVRAAAELGMGQSGVSNAIHRLEDELGVQLLARTTRRVNLTEDGAAFLQRCRQILADLDEARQTLGQARTQPSGRLRIDLPSSFGRLKIVPLLGAFRAAYPGLTLAVTLTDRYIDLIEEAVDVTVRLGALTGLQPDRPPPDAIPVQDGRLARLLRPPRPPAPTGGSRPAQLPVVPRPRHRRHPRLAIPPRRRRCLDSAEGRHELQRWRRTRDRGARRLWDRADPGLLRRSRHRGWRGRAGAREFQSEPQPDLAGLPADAAPFAEGAGIRRLHDRAV
jgi:DNA-binding transcriptional LysR family regulator